MKTKNYLSLSILSFFLFLYTSCQKDDFSPVTDRVYANGIKQLNATPVDVTESTFKFGDELLKPVPALDVAEIDGRNYIVGYNVTAGQFAVSLSETFDPDGTFVIFRLSEEDVYTGQNFTISTKKSSITLSGQVTNASNDTRTLELTLQESQFEGGNSAYTINGNVAQLSGTLGNYTYNQIIEINANFPEVEIIELGTIQGSVNDDINVETGRLIRAAGYTTHLSANSMIASGGVDLFCSGKERTMEEGALMGVHSWCCVNGKTADELPKRHAGHKSQLKYFKEMLGDVLGEDFYFFTLQAAPFEEIHFMSEEEIEQYQLITN